MLYFIYYYFVFFFLLLLLKKLVFSKNLLFQKTFAAQNIFFSVRINNSIFSKAHELRCDYSGGGVIIRSLGLSGPPLYLGSLLTF